MTLTPNQRRQLDRQLEAMGLLPYQNPGLTPTQLNALIANANISVPRQSTGINNTGGAGTTPRPPVPTTTVPPLPTTPASATPTTTTPAGGAVIPVSDPFRSILQTMLPYLSPEDQRLMADVHGRDILNLPGAVGPDGTPRQGFNRDIFGAPDRYTGMTGELSPSPQILPPASIPIPSIPSEINRDTRETYLSRSRAENALTALQRLAPNIRDSGGPGFNFLTNALNILRDFGGQEGGMSRENYLRFDRATRELLTEAGGMVGPYGDLVSRLLFPGFSAGSLMNFRNSGNNPVFGSANRRLYT